MILGLRQDPRPILTRSERHVEIEQDPRRQSAHLHVSKVLADAAKGPHGEGCKSILVLDQLVALAVPALGEEGGGGGVDAVVCLGEDWLAGWDFRGVSVAWRRTHLCP